jgi:hypothetical protein
LSSKQKYPKLAFKQSIDRLKSYIYYLLLVVGAGVSHARCARVVGAGTGGGQASSAMVATLQAMAEAILMNLAAAALGILIEVKGGVYWCSRALANVVVALTRSSSSWRRFVALLAVAMLRR